MMLLKQNLHLSNYIMNFLLVLFYVSADNSDKSQVLLIEPVLAEKS